MFGIIFHMEYVSDSTIPHQDPNLRDMPRLILLLTYIILFTSSCKLDKEIEVSDNIKLNSLLIQIDNANNQDEEEMIHLALQYVTYGKDIQDSTLIKLYYAVGTFQDRLGKIDSSALYFQKAIGFINDSIQSELETWVFRKAHHAYQSLGADEECAAISTKFASLIDKASDHRNMATYYGLKEEYFKTNPQKNIDSILKYNQLGIERLKLTNQKNQVANLKITRAAFISSYLRDYDRSTKIIEEVIAIEDELKTDTKRLLYNDYGILKYWQSDFYGAINYYKKGLQFIDDSVEKRNRLAGGYGNIAEAYLKLNDFENSELYLDSLRSLGSSGIEERFKTFLKHLELELEFKKEKNISKTLASVKRYAGELKSENAKKYKSDLVTLEQTLETRKEVLEESNKAKLKLINQKWYSFLLGFSLLGLVIFGFFFYRQKRIKFELQQLLLQQRLLRSQMNPHFTYNFLSLIKNQIKNNQEKATQYLLKFSRLLRMILDNSTYNYVELNTEVDILSKYVELQSLRFPQGLSFETKFTDMNEDEMIFVPPMIFQPIIENCIVHGFADIDYLGLISIEFIKEKNVLRCKIEDNGSGINQSNEQKRKSSTQLISEFLEKATKSKLKIINKPDGQSGTIVRFALPFKYSQFD